MTALAELLWERLVNHLFASTDSDAERVHVLRLLADSCSRMGDAIEALP